MFDFLHNMLYNNYTANLQQIAWTQQHRDIAKTQNNMKFSVTLVHNTLPSGIHAY